VFPPNDSLDLRRAGLPGVDDRLNRPKLAIGEAAGEFQRTFTELSGGWESRKALNKDRNVRFKRTSPK
jgi:hypothetical protein